jgi:hypothetical protein
MKQSTTQPSTDGSEDDDSKGSDDAVDGEGDDENDDVAAAAAGSSSSSSSSKKVHRPRRRGHRITEKDRRQARKAAQAREVANEAKLLAMDDQLDAGEFDHATWVIDGVLMLHSGPALSCHVVTHQQ